MILLHCALTALMAGTTAPSFYVANLPTPESSARLARSLRVSESPRERAFGAILDSDEGNSSRAEGGRILRAAARSAPDDVFVQATWTLAYPDASGCDAASPCPERPAAFARVEPDNGLAWLAAIGELDPEKDREAIDRMLARMAAAKRFDDHYVDGLEVWSRMLVAQAVPADAAQVQAIIYGSLWFPETEKLVGACKRKENSGPCTRIGRTMARTGTSLMTQRVGHRLLRICRLADAADDRAYLEFAWLEHSRFALGETLETAAEVRRMYMDVLDTGNEASAVALALKRHGVPLAPPPGWEPDS